MINYAKWIWAEEKYNVNEYADFIREFNIDAVDKNATMQICVDSEYALYINGKFVSSGQYGNYPENQKYDELSIGKFLKTGMNKIAICAYYQGESSSRYKAGERGLIFALKNNDEVVFSDLNTLSRLSNTYKSGKVHFTTTQMGFGFEYDATGEDDFIKEDYIIDSSWKNAKEKEIKTTLTKRPILKLNIGKEPETKIIAQGDFLRKGASKLASELVMTDYLSFTEFDRFFEGKNTFPVKLIERKPETDGIYFIVDLGKEMCGYITFTLTTNKGARVDISHGEHLDDLRVRAKIDYRNFTDTYICREGKQTFTHYARRIAGRYLQINISNFKNLSVDYVGIKPLKYPFSDEGTFKCSDSLHNKVFDVCLDTLKLCMHEHYEDCPWREQALYASDTRNSALCAYYTLGGSKEFTRASLKLLCESVLDETYVNLTAPSKSELTIPSFTMIFLLSLKEYTEFSGDVSLVKENWEIIKKMVNNFSKNSFDGILKPVDLKDIKTWNFYEWSCEDYNTKKLIGENYDKIKDGLYHIFSYMGITSAIWIAKKVGDNDFADKYLLFTKDMKKVFNETFWNNHKKVFASHVLNGEQIRFDELTQAMALYTGICDEDKKDFVLDALSNKDNDLIKLSISYLIYKYEVLLEKGMKYADIVFEEIADKWGNMLYLGATSIWENEKVEDHMRAMSRCHAWSTTPIIVYCKYVLGLDFKGGKVRFNENSPCKDYFAKFKAKLPIIDFEINKK